MSAPLNIIWMVFWAVALFCGLWVAGGCAAFYIVLYIFVPCLPKLTDGLRILHKGILLPYFAADNFMQARGPVEGFKHIYETTPPS